MIYNLYDLLNFFLCFFALLFSSIIYKFSNRVLLLLFLHLVFVAFSDLIIPISYLPDQFRYYQVSMSLRGLLPPTDEVGTVYFAGLYLSFFPLFIVSVKSISFINYMLYLSLYCFLVTKFSTVQIVSYFKRFYLLYPSLFLYSSLGLRDMMIAVIMMVYLYLLLFGVGGWRLVIMMLLVLLLFPIKSQNSAILIVCTLCSIIELCGSRTRRILYAIYFILLIAIIMAMSNILDMYRLAMYYDDTGMLPIGGLDPWTPLDLYRFFLAPLFFDARNAMQLIQSCENLALFYIGVKLIRFSKKINIKSMKSVIFINNIFFIVAGIMYSYVVFNYGTITRYKLPFVFCWITIMFLIFDKYLSEELVRRNGDEKQVH